MYFTARSCLEKLVEAPAKQRLVTGVVAIAFLAPGAALGGTHGGERVARDVVTGAGSNEFALGALGEAHFALGAVSDLSGMGVRGWVTSKGDPDGLGPIEPFTARGKVTCLRAEGNRASLKWRIEHATGSAEPFVGGGVQSFLEDNGEPRRGEPLDGAVTDPPQPARSFDLHAGQCDDPDSRGALYERLEAGNVTIRDGAGR